MTNAKLNGGSDKLMQTRELNNEGRSFTISLKDAEAFKLKMGGSGYPSYLFIS